MNVLALTTKESNSKGVVEDLQDNAHGLIMRTLKGAERVSGSMREGASTFARVVDNISATAGAMFGALRNTITGAGDGYKESQNTSTNKE